MQRDSFRKVFLPIYFFNAFSRASNLLNWQDQCTLIDSFLYLARQTVNENFLVKNERVEFHVTRVVGNNDSEEKKREGKGNNSVEFRIMFFEGREKKKERERKCRNERKMENPTVRENLKFYQMESIREPLPPRFISNDGKVYSKVYSHYKYLFFP